jgi:hypothetical protein
MEIFFGTILYKGQQILNQKTGTVVPSLLRQGLSLNDNL